jgi:hypothetical protein
MGFYFKKRDAGSIDGYWKLGGVSNKSTRLWRELKGERLINDRLKTCLLAF